MQLETDPHWEGEYIRTLVGRVYKTISDGEWWSVQRLSPVVDGTETAVSSCLRDLRKPKYGGHAVQRRRLENGISEYQLIQSLVK